MRQGGRAGGRPFRPRAPVAGGAGLPAFVVSGVTGDACGRAVRPARHARAWITTDYIHPRTFVSAWVGDTSDRRDWPPTATRPARGPAGLPAPWPNGQSAGPDTLADSRRRAGARSQRSDGTARFIHSG